MLRLAAHPPPPVDACCFEAASSRSAQVAAYYCTKKACEPVHAQLDLPDYRLAVINTVALANRGKQAALNVKLTLLDAQGKRILPACYSDNYVALLPGQQRVVEVQ